MNKYLYLTMTAFTLTIQKAYCLSETISPELDQSLKIHTNEPGILHIICALLFVIFLIYVTGLIYSKLNIVGAKTLKEQLKNSDINRAIVLSTTQLGPNRNLHVIEVNDKCYLIGSTANSINLIKDLGSAKEEKIEDRPKQASEEDIDKAIKFLYGKSTEEVIEQTPQETQEFSIHKKYLQ